MVFQAAMAGEISAQAVPDETTKVNNVQRQTTDTLQKDSLWQSANCGCSDSSTKDGLAESVAKMAVLGGVLGFEAKDKDGSGRSSLSIQIGKDAVGRKTDDPREKLTIEERTRLVEKIDKSINDQTIYHTQRLFSTGLMLAGVLAYPTARPGALAMGAIGLAATLYNGLKAQDAGNDAVQALRSLPQTDVQRFGKAVNDMAFSDDFTSSGYMAAGVFALIDHTYGFKNLKTTETALPVAVGIDVYNSVYKRPTIADQFRSDVAAWKQGLK